MCSGILRSVACEEISRAAATAQIPRNMDRNQAVLAVTLFLTAGHPRVAGDMSYCCRPAVLEIGVCSGEHSSVSAKREMLLDQSRLLLWLLRGDNMQYALTSDRFFGLQPALDFGILFGGLFSFLRCPRGLQMRA